MLNTLLNAYESFKDIFFRPTKTKNIYLIAILTTVGPIAAVSELKLDPSKFGFIIFVGMLTPVALILTKVKRKAEKEFFTAKISKTTKDKIAFKLGQKAAQGWIPYAKSYFNRVAYNNMPAFSAGMRDTFENSQKNKPFRYPAG